MIFEKMISKIRQNDSFYTRHLNCEVNYYSLLRNSLGIKIENEDWHMQLNDKNELLLSSMNSSVDLSKSSINELRILNGKVIDFSNQCNMKPFIIKDSLIVGQNIYFGNGYKKCTTANAFEIINRNYMSDGSHCFRAIIPYHRKITNIMFVYHFAHWIEDKTQRMCISMQTDAGLMNLNGIEFLYNNVKFLVYNYCTSIGSDDRYIVIESMNEMKYDDYISCSNNILNVVGFFTTKYQLGPYMIFDTKTSDPTLVAYANRHSEPCVSRYTMLTLNPYAYYLDGDICQLQSEGTNDKSTANGLGVEDKLRPIEKRHFEKLLSFLSDNFFSDMFFSFQQVSTTSINGSGYAHVINLVIYAACLEAAAKWFRQSYNNDKENMRTTLLSHDTREAITSAFFDVLDKFDEESHEDITKLKRKIQTSLFNIPNADNLSAPFEYFGISLSEDDKKTLQLRNKILHGTNIIESEFDMANVMPYLAEVERHCFAFHSLLWRLIMKAIGYDGVYRDEYEINNKFMKNESNNGAPLIKNI